MTDEPDIVISDEMRALLLEYMTACNEGRYADSEGLILKIKEQGAIDHEKRSA